MSKQIELMKKFIKCVEMCEKDGGGVDPVRCVKVEGYVATYVPYFDATGLSYEFAVAIIEGKPVFIGDRLYSNGEPFILDNNLGGGVRSLAGISWNPPKKKRMFMLNGEELPCPENKSREDTYNIILFDEEYGFATECDRDKVIGSLKKLLEDARSDG